MALGGHSESKIGVNKGTNGSAGVHWDRRHSNRILAVPITEIKVPGTTQAWKSRHNVGELLGSSSLNQLNFPNINRNCTVKHFLRSSDCSHLHLWIDTENCSR
jgi:hypothetical protein